jgi:hypothetical protein
MLFFLFLFFELYAQEIKIEQELDEIYVDQDYDFKYRQALRRIRRVYPLALKAADLMHELDAQLSEENSRRKRKKITKNVHESIKDQYLYVIKDLYIQEGVLLMKLIYRETGLSTAEIMVKYKGRFKAGIYEQVAKLWDQNLDSRYDPSGKDWIIEKIIQEIKTNQIYFDSVPHLLSRNEFKKEKQDYKINVKESKMQARKQKKEANSKKNTKVISK